MLGKVLAELVVGELHKRQLSRSPRQSHVDRGQAPEAPQGVQHGGGAQPQHPQGTPLSQVGLGRRPAREVRHLGDHGGDPVAQSCPGDDGVPSGEGGAPEGDAVGVDAVGEGGL